MSTFVLVPGFWLGAWAWREVTERLRADGHTAYPLTLTGLADREHLGGPETRLDTHIDDIVTTILHEDLREVVLVAHSGAGGPVTGAADRVPDRIAKVVYLDSGPLPDGLCQLDFYEPEGRDFVRSRLSDGWRYGPPTWQEQTALGASTAGIPEDAKPGIAARMTPQPYGTLTQPLRLAGAGADLPKALVSCSFPLDQVKAMIAAAHPFFAALSGPEWELHALPTGHWPMFSRPSDTAHLLGSL
ncbi:alpha/beta fold hydrolase [Sphaerisporangium krabiense]|uniref:Pimeloyl-ACP methyl ester carboxylesterase n=1 Tax=Sphaerisporangium krabiense TaxID=763782 RepID=A0A7W9DU67_9ACTN|nr:alpha/beta hydrolase [Sphaerisporangium krabiense]MBB5631358.1 pimeloyl-ACP methyl ester carboxylesterase [Sphaerisporangium krabiense]